MGINVFGSSCDEDTVDAATAPNPNKFRFEITSITEGRKYDVIEVVYLDCTTYNGRKLLVAYHGTVTPGMRELDPHLLVTGPVVARFKPDVEGLRLAEVMRLM